MGGRAGAGRSIDAAFTALAFFAMVGALLDAPEAGQSACRTQVRETTSIRPRARRGGPPDLGRFAAPARRRRGDWRPGAGQV
jgi:hypothetical protein